MKNPQWLLLLYQIPAKSDSARVKIWRTLQKIGAVAVKNSVAAVPDISGLREKVINIADEVVSIGGEAIVTEGSFIFGLSEDSLVQSYNAQLEMSYRTLAQEIQETTKEIPSNASANELMRWDHKRTKFQSLIKELNERSIGKIKGQEPCEENLSAFERKLKGHESKSKIKTAKVHVGSTWVTRKNLHIDRMASAWLIKRYIDPKAHFLFVDIDKYKHKPEHIRFDVFNGEYGHIGDQCTFETLISEFKIKEPSVTILAQIIHDLDIDDKKFSRKETEGIRMALEGIVRAYKSDEDRLQMASSLLDGLILSLTDS